MDEMERHIPESSARNNKDLWSRNWKVQVPNCVKSFLWRLGCNILPTKSNLEKKGIQLDVACPLCHSAPETQEHIFMNCPISQLVWFASPLGIHMPEYVNVQSWLERWLVNPDVLGQQFICIVLWKIWKHRNQLIFNQSSFDPKKVMNDASNFVADFNSENSALPRPSSTQTEVKWTAPEPGTVKINFDAGCFASGSAGWGMIARDSNGRVYFAATKLDAITVSPLMAEALGLRWCLTWAATQNLDSLLFETDAEMLVKSIARKLKLVELN